MPPRKPAHVFAMVIAAILPVCGLTWSAGFLYWHVTITRAIAVLERRAKEARLYEDPLHPEELHRAESRAIPYLLRASERAIAAWDRDSAVQFQSCLQDVIQWANTAPDELLRPRDLFIRGPIPVLQEVQVKNREWWERHREDYPAWWMWWSGHRRYGRSDD